MPVKCCVTLWLKHILPTYCAFKIQHKKLHGELSIMDIVNIFAAMNRWKIRSIALHACAVSEKQNLSLQGSHHRQNSPLIFNQTVYILYQSLLSQSVSNIHVHISYSIQITPKKSQQFCE